MTRARKTTGRITFVGAGPGDPGLLTVRAAEALRSAALILLDPDVPDEPDPEPPVPRVVELPDADVPDDPEPRVLELSLSPEPRTLSELLPNVEPLP